MKAQQLGERSRVGGWRGSPNSIAALLAHQVLYPHQDRGGRRRRLSGDGFGRGERRYLGRLERRGLLPLELLALPCWRRLTEFPTAQRSPMRLALLQAWDKRDKAPLHWSRTQAKALALVPAGPGGAYGYMADR